MEKPNAKWEIVTTLLNFQSEGGAIIKTKESAYFFGGFNIFEYSYSNGLTEINLESFEQKIINENVYVPNPRSMHSIVLINAKIYLFGGISSDTIFNDVWTFDLIEDKWNQVKTFGDIPTPRYLHAASSDGDAFTIWGGEDFYGLKDEMFIFNSLQNLLKNHLKQKEAAFHFKRHSIYIWREARLRSFR